MMNTKCPLIVKNYMKPLGDDFSVTAVDYGQFSQAFDVRQPVPDRPGLV